MEKLHNYELLNKVTKILYLLVARACLLKVCRTAKRDILRVRCMTAQ